jgi:hypothetical protein
MRAGRNVAERQVSITMRWQKKKASAWYRAKGALAPIEPLIVRTIDEAGYALLSKNSVINRRMVH